MNRESSFIKNVLKLMTGNIAAQGLAILTMPIITRFFTPEMYGTAALFVSITTILGLIACLRYEYAIILPDNDEEAVNVLAASFFSTLIVTLITIIIVYFMGKYFIQKFHAQAIKDYLWLIPLAVMILGINSMLIYWNSRKKRFSQQAKIKYLSSVIMQGTKIIAGFIGIASSGILVLTSLLGSISTILLLSINLIVRNDYVIFRNNISFSNIITAFKRYKKFPLVDLWGGFLNAASWQLPTFMLAFFFSPGIVGFWALGYAVVRMPITLIGQSFGNVFFQKISEDKNTGMYTKTVSCAFKFLISYGLPPMVLLGIIGEDLFIVVFGGNWSEAGVFTQILAPWLFFNFVTSATSTIFYAFDKLTMAFYIHLLIFLSRFFSLYIGGIMGDIYLALLLYSLSGVLIYGCVSLLSFKIAKLQPVIFLKYLIRHIIYFMPCGMLIYFLKLELEQINYLIISGIITVLYLGLIVTPNDPMGRTLLRGKD